MWKDKDNAVAFCPLDNMPKVLLAHGATVFVLFLSFMLLIMFNSKRNYFPVRERAPRIAVVQGLISLFQVIVVYIVEIGYELEISLFEWGDTQNVNNIPVSRIAFKSLYLTFRLNIYLVFLLR